MKPTRSRASLLSRLERLECRAAARSRIVKFRFGHLKRLPREYQGERHVIITRELPKQGDREWVEFEEVPGPDPDPPRPPARGSPHPIDIMFVEAYPYTETALESCIPFYIADMRNLGEVPASRFDAVICMDNALPHLHSEADLTQAAGQIRAKLRIGGTFVASIRDYDEILAHHPVTQGPAFYSDKGKRRIVFQVWDWHDDRRYTFHMYITRETSAGWTNFHGASAYRAVLRHEITANLESRGFTNIRWQFPIESRFYQPIVIATATE